jgi:adenylate cyclase
MKWLGRTKRSILLGGFVITLLVAGTFIFKPSYLNLLELKLYDTFLQKFHTSIQTDSVVIVDIDDQSLETYGQWPWPRYRVGRMLENINNAKPMAVGLDILFSEPDRTSPLVLKQTLKQDFNIELGFPELSKELMDNDKLLSDVLSQGPFVLGFSGVFHSTEPSELTAIIPVFNATQVKSAGANSADTYLFQATELIPPLAVLLEGTQQTGFMNTLTDRDGVLRRTPLIISHKGKIYPQLSIACLMTALPNANQSPVINVSRQGVESLLLNTISIPLSGKGSMMVNYRGPRQTFPYISAKNILEKRFKYETIANKIVFVGTSASGLKDIRISPLDQVFPGVEVHATIIDNILSNDFIFRPDWAPGFELVLILVWGVATTILIGWANVFFTLPVTIALGLLAWFGCGWIFDRMNIWVSPFFPVILLVINFSLLSMQKFWFSEQKKRFFKSAFSKYVSSSVVDQLVQNPEKLSLEGEEKEISILFADIRKFTTISETLSPSQITLLLHDYFTAVTDIIIKNRGTHDKFIGDAVMSFWNAPVDVASHEKYAIKAAVEMLRALDELNRSFKKSFGIQIEVGIGLHTGLCRVGNMGSDDIFDYTIIGDNVNLASRLESLTKYYSVPLIVSEQMLRGKTDRMISQELDLVRVKGKDKPVRIFTIFTDDDTSNKPSEKETVDYQKGLALYRNRDFKTAETVFSHLKQSHPDRLIYSIYTDRCRLLMTNPPAEDWDGVFTHQEK